MTDADIRRMLFFKIGVGEKETERNGAHPLRMCTYGNQLFRFALCVAYFTKCVIVRKIECVVTSAQPVQEVENFLLTFRTATPNVPSKIVFLV